MLQSHQTCCHHFIGLYVLHAATSRVHHCLSSCCRIQSSPTPPFSIRLCFKENAFRCSYILPDGITYKKGFVKDMDESLRYCSLPLDGESDRKDHGLETNKSEDWKTPELSQNVTSLVSVI